ncbi:unnamed protein product [Dibothriocephalus latus]|uniref:3-hydroxyacyl-CoA dehydrogenase NAD binding domain-containing protein n=1 Tax=Dibothriocephalus latus TaxID=60516 RepID=A0A3P7PKN1_DIBLA|nr:unnamed protein product [Dibothriocephalus latus]
MGAGIAQVSAQRGLPTIMRDVSIAGLARGQHQIQTNLDKMVKRKRMSVVEREQVSSMYNWCLFHLYNIRKQFFSMKRHKSI